ncbi:MULTISPECIES: hypothetical protein [unclassified Nocardia]|uniref:hypothetical protein n=1 Tax=unclassified Nocardia TaxID=2637762 RepID=UPI001CE456CC|nr:MULTISPECIES: hypothetical protein [unclassified Nocardia]
MPGWQDFLDRFRPAGAPGSAVPRGIPADRPAEAAAELLPVLALLDDAQDRADRIRRDAIALAAQLRGEAAAEARAIVERAREQVEFVAQQATDRLLAANPPTDTAPTAIELRAEDRLPAYVARVTARAHQLIAELCTATGPVAR